MGLVVSLDEAVALRPQWRAAQKTLVLTNGCFDLLHIGHVRYLQAARQLGDLLLVAVNDDASTRALKGEGRPIVPAAERAELLASLGCVDYVLLFGELTAERVVDALRPDIYVKGGDYHPAAAAGRAWPEAALVESYGGRVVVGPLVEGHSTSALIERVLRSSRRPGPGP
jgi:rfaE bifunctional protein nucleotidyltransferase chain/domain